MPPTMTKIHEAPAGLEDRVRAAIRQHDEFKAQAAARVAAPAPKAPMAKVAQPQQKAKGPKPRRERKPYVPSPMSAVRIGLMAETAWARLSPVEREHGLPLWRLAALANLKFIPSPAAKLEHLQGNLMVFRLVNPVGDPAKSFGWAFVARPLPGYGQKLEGIKLFDHRGSVLVVVGHAPMGVHEKASPYTAGVFDGPDELPVGWVYRRASDKKPDEAITRFISACMPLRQTL